MVVCEILRGLSCGEFCLLFAGEEKSADSEGVEEEHEGEGVEEEEHAEDDETVEPTGPKPPAEDAD